MLKSICIAFILLDVTLAVLQEQGLYRVCRHTYMDFLGELPVDQRVTNDYCEQKIEVVVESLRAAKSVCRRAVPFRVKETKHEPDGTVRCKWESRTTCPNANHILIDDRCYHLGKRTTASNAKTGCSGKSTLHYVKSLEEAKFISVFLSSDEPVHVINNRKGTSYDLFDQNSIIYTADNFDVDTSDTEAYFILNMVNYDLHEVRPAKLVSVKDDVKLRTLCSEPAKTYARQEESWEQIPEHLFSEDQKVNGNLVIKTTNVYQPDASGERDVSVTNLHAVCQKLCDECFAALPNMQPELAVYKIIKNVGGIHAKSPVLPMNNSDGTCASDPKWDMRRADFQTQDENGKTSGVEPSRFAANYPNNMCADGLNTALISMPNADLHDSPTITRHPIVCVKGTKPTESKFSMCRQNSVEIYPGQCRCKPGYRDIMNTTLAQKKDFVPGQMCTPEKPCSTTQKTMAFTFILDYSLSIVPNSLKTEMDFVKSAKNTIPKSASVNSVVYSQYVFDFPWLHSGAWDDGDFDKLVPKRVQHEIDQYYENRTQFLEINGKNKTLGQITATHAALGKAIQKSKEVSAERKFFILITDGVPVDTRAALVKARKVKEHGIKLLIVPIGNAFTGRQLATIPEMVKASGGSIIDLTGDMDEQLTEKAMKDIIETLCEPTTWEDYLDSIQ